MVTSSIGTIGMPASGRASPHDLPQVPLGRDRNDDHRIQRLCEVAPPEWTDRTGSSP
jgi:hypothetical protein